MKAVNIFTYVLLFIVLYLLIKQIDIFNFSSGFPFIDLKFKNKVIVENDAKIKAAEEKSKELLKKEAIHLTFISNQKHIIDSLKKEIASIKGNTGRNIMVLNESFKDDSANTRLEYRKRIQWFGWLPDIPSGPLTFRETGIGAILFEKYYGTDQELNIQIATNLHQDSIITDLEILRKGDKDLRKIDSTIISSLKEQKAFLHYPFVNEISAGVKTILFEKDFVAALFARYKYKIINKESFEMYIAAEGNYSNLGIGAATEAGLSFKFGF